MADLLFFPGALTDYRLLALQKQAFPDMHIPDWIAPLSKDEPLVSYAKRMAETLPLSKAFYLGGVSLGGMLAVELARCLKPEAVILVASSAKGKCVSPPWRMAGKIVSLMPTALVRFCLKFLGKVLKITPTCIIKKCFTIGKTEQELLAEMLMTIPPALVQWQCQAAISWESQEELDIPLYHIHGAKDSIIPLRLVKPTMVIEEGAHLINLTHAAIVNQFISSQMM